jgi:cytochrome c-type biogenesis protein
MQLNALIQDVAASFQAAGPALKFVFALFGGVLSSFTPCVFPLLPIVAITIGASNTTGTKLRAFTLSLTYAAGLAAVFAALGLFAGLAGASLGRIASHPIAFLIVAVFFAFFALMMFDIYTMPVPQSIIKAGASAQQKRGYFAVAATGAISGIIAAPCLGPVVLFILTYIARDGDPVSGFFMMLLYALGVATLPIIVGTFAGAAATLQKKQGAWMTRVKHVFGWFFILFALYYSFSAGRNYIPAMPPGADFVSGGAPASSLLWDVAAVEPGDIPAKAGDRILDIEFVKGGEKMKLSDNFTPGKITLLTFWSTNCPECIAEMPHLLSVYNKYKDRGFSVISVNTVTNESRQTVEAFVARRDMPYPIIFDAGHAIWNAYDLFGTPTNIMFDSTGKIVDYSITLSAKMEDIIEAHIGE